MSMKRQP